MKEWYKKEVATVLEETNSGINGLTSEEVKIRQEEQGLNIIPKAKKDSPLVIFLSEFKDPIILLLIVAIILSFVAGEILDGFAIMFIIFIDAIIGTVEEVRAEKSAEALEKFISFKIKVLRNGAEIEIDSSQLVVGDIVLVEPGNKISGDLRVIESKNLTIDESILTGESINTTKNSETINKDVPLGDRHNMLYAGTSVITGRGKAVVVEIGVNTEFGKIAEKVQNTEEAPSPLTIRMNKFSKQITILIIMIAIVVAGLLLYKGNDLTTVFLSVIALSVSAMPEGLPLALTMALTIGSNRMVKKNVIVKKLNSVESLGSCTIIASDKTGTLTVNEQTAKKIVLPSGSTFNVKGTGYNDKGEVIPEEGANLEEARKIIELGVMNNEARLYKEQDKWIDVGDSMDVAFLALGLKIGIEEPPYEKIGMIPYESENKYSAVFYKMENKIYCSAKGSLEKILSMSPYMIEDGKRVSINESKIKKQNEELAKEGYRVIALAYGEKNNFVEKDVYDEKDIDELTFLGLVAFIDPIREETKQSIDDCHNAGIKVVMITGDHPLTAYAIAHELKIAKVVEEVTNSEEIEKVYNTGQKEFDEFIKNKKVFARVTPIQKLYIVESFKRQNEFIAVTGDGVNDSPAIKAANIGIAMGSGTDVAKETSSMIITDDNFLSIVSGIKEGRNAYANIRKIVYFLVSCGISEVLFFLLATLFNMPMPLVAIQLIWLNVVTDGLQDLALSFEREDKDLMKDKPKDTNESLFDKLLIEELIISGLFIGFTVFAVWTYLIKNVGMEIGHARGYIMALMVFIQNLHVINCKSEKKSILKYHFTENPMVLISIFGSVGLQILIMEIEPLSKALSTYSVPLTHMVQLLLAAVPIVLVMELFKYYKRTRDKRNL